MTISLFELFSIGIGPSSSHTVGPMRAGRDFLLSLGDSLQQVTRIEVSLFGSLAFTGIGHGSEKAILLGLLGEQPETVNPETVTAEIKQIKTQQSIKLLQQHTINFVFDRDFIFNTKKMYPYHSNAMKFRVFNKKKILKQEVYYSIGGGFIINDSELQNPQPENAVTLPYPFNKAKQLLSLCEDNNFRIKDLMLENEKAWRDETTIREGILAIAQAMEDSIDRGCRHGGILEGGLNVRRRAPALYARLQQQSPTDSEHSITMGYLNAYAMAVNEENAAGGRVVTAPTNGAAGTIPAVLRYYKQFCKDANEQGVIELLLTSAAIGILYKKNASISGAEMGCQGEVGVACSMAAAGLTAALGGTIYQIENAAEMAMEHNLGLTCDPVAGLVQIPCIERNAMAAVKAVNATYLALAESGEHKVSLDMVIDTMREIGHNMNSMYKETSKGGLAVNVPEC